MLDQVAQRAGAIELAVYNSSSAPQAARSSAPNDAPHDEPLAEPADAAPAAFQPGDVVWRCKLLLSGDNEIVVEMPTAIGKPLHVGIGTSFVAAFTVGQNRWMFHTSVAGYKVFSHHGREHAALVLSLPEKVERCSRREHFRISTARLNLPRVQCWPLLDPSSVIAAEAANRACIRELMAKDAGLGALPALSTDAPDSILLPEVGPMFEARLLNMSGGGLGLLVATSETAALDRSRHLWLRLDLRPTVPLPIAITAKRAHTHLDSTGNTQAGLSFDFAFNPEHQKFVQDLLIQYLEQIQRASVNGARKAG